MMRIGLYDAADTKHIHDVRHQHPPLVVVKDVGEGRNNSIARIIIEHPLSDREALFFVSVKEGPNGRPILCIVTKGEDGRETEKQLTGKWWDKKINRSEVE